MAWAYDDDRHHIRQRREDRPAGDPRALYRQDIGPAIDDYLGTLAATGRYRNEYEGPQPYGRGVDGSHCPLGVVARDYEGREIETPSRLCPLAMGNEHRPRRRRHRGTVRPRRRQRPDRVSWWVNLAPIALLFTLGGFIGMLIWRLT